MLRFIGLLLLWIMASFAYSFSGLPEKATLSFVMENIERGGNCPDLMKNAPVIVDYDYNFEKNMGLANLRQIQSVSLSETLFPLGLSKYYAFMSDMKPRKISLPEGDVVVFRIILHLYKSGESKVFLMLNQDGECIMSSNIVKVEGSQRRG